MVQTPSKEQFEPSPNWKNFSCLICRQRKVKCDRRNPCSNCVKIKKQCSFVAPVRGKRKKTKPPKEGLHAKLKRYEALLESHGVKIAPSECDESDDEIISEPDNEVADAQAHSERYKPRLITNEGVSRYLDSSMWSNFGDEIRLDTETVVESMEEPQLQPWESSFYDENGLILGEHFEKDVSGGFSRTPPEYPQDRINRVSAKNLASLYPLSSVLQDTWTIFIDRVDPMVRITHLPTFWTTLSNAIECPHDLPKSLEALIFAFLFVTINSLEDGECQSLFQEQRSVMLMQYKRATCQALANAGFLETYSLMTLQAYCFFIIGLRGKSHNDSLYTLTGVAVRLARRMGLHKDGTSLGIPPFETEIRRRVWWYIVNIDCKTADFSGTKPSMDIFHCDTRVPLNVEDEDLKPDMTEPPPERTGITSMVLRLIICDMMTLFNSHMISNASLGPYEVFGSPKTTLAEKDRMIDEIKDKLENKYLRYCDPSNSVHLLASITVRSLICKFRLMAHNPRQFANEGLKVPQRERDFIFANGTKLMEYVNLLQNSRSLRKYLWQINKGQFWDSLAYVLIEARRRRIGPEVDRIWELIEGVFSKYAQIFATPPGSLYAALGQWTLQVWEEYVAAREAEGLSPITQVPEYISILRHNRKASATPSLKPNGQQAKFVEDSVSEAPTLIDDRGCIAFEQVETHDFSNLLSFDLEPEEWMQWDRLFAGNDD